ncbi:MAG: LacI family DNA-binding transcriptional regulator, partial [Aristaeellaceae bacterium]
MKVRIRDIAEKAGVSSATVSNALNGKGGVSEHKMKQIMSIAREMGYIFERTSLSHKEYIRLVIFKRHGLVVMDTQFFAEILESMTREARQHGYELLMSHINMEKDQDYLEQIREICVEECAGIILLATEMFTEDVRLFLNTKAPLLILDSMFRHDDLNCVVMNNYEAGFTAV